MTGTVREIRIDLEDKEKTNHLLHIETPDGCKAHSLYHRALMWTL